MSEKLKEDRIGFLMMEKILWGTYDNAQMNSTMKNQRDGKSTSQMKATACNVKMVLPFEDTSFDAILDVVIKNYVGRR